MGPGPSQEPPQPPRLQQCHHSSGGFLTPSNMMDVYEILNLNLLSSKENIKNVIKDPSPSQEPPRSHKLQHSVIILEEGS